MTYCVIWVCFPLAVGKKYNVPWLFLEVIVRIDEMHDPFSPTHKYAGPGGGLSGYVLSALHHTAAVYTVSLSGERPEDKGRKRGKDLAGEIKISAWRWENNLFAVQFNQARWGTLLFIFLFTAPLTFLSPFPPARHSRRITSDLGQRILNSTFFYLKLPQLQHNLFLRYQNKTVIRCAFAHFNESRRAYYTVEWLIRHTVIDEDRWGSPLSSPLCVSAIVISR